MAQRNGENSKPKQITLQQKKEWLNLELLKEQLECYLNCDETYTLMDLCGIHGLKMPELTQLYWEIYGKEEWRKRRYKKHLIRQRNLRFEINAANRERNI